MIKRLIESDSRLIMNATLRCFVESDYLESKRNEGKDYITTKLRLEITIGYSSYHNMSRSMYVFNFLFLPKIKTTGTC